MVTDMSMERRIVTRSLSNELQARAQTQQQPNNSERPDLMARDPSSLLRNTSEEMFIRSLVENSMAMTAPNMEGIGFSNNMPQTMRLDSEELFHNWISDVESQASGQNHTSHRARQASRRMSNELASLLRQNNTFNRVDSLERFLQSGLPFSDGSAGDASQPKTNRNVTTEKEDQAIEFQSLKDKFSWFQQNQPMTRSRSSELRRRYAAMQGMHLPPTTDSIQGNSIQDHKQQFSSLEAFTRNFANEGITQPVLFQQLHQPLGSNFNVPLQGTGNPVSTVVSMLKGTLERKKLGNSQQLQQQQNIVADLYPVRQRVQEELFNRLAGPQFQTAIRVDSPRQLPTTASQLRSENNGQVPQIHYDTQTQMGVVSTNNCQIQSTAPSPSNSSSGAPVLSIGDDQFNAGQMNPNQDNALKRSALLSSDVDQQPKRQNSIGNHPSPSSYGAVNSEPQLESIQKMELSKKPPNLSRVGSLTSSGGSGFPMDKEDPTKKRRVERQRKMLEAKGRLPVPVMPSDLQAALKRCDTLEKEVRSLKLNLSFMNRKDSEQTKQIEDLQAQNEKLQEERDRLLNELERLKSLRG